MSSLTDEKRKAMEAEMSRFEDEIAGTQLDSFFDGPDTHRPIIGSQTYSQVEERLTHTTEWSADTTVEPQGPQRPGYNAPQSHSSNTGFSWAKNYKPPTAPAAPQPIVSHRVPSDRMRCTEDSAPVARRPPPPSPSMNSRPQFVPHQLRSGRGPVPRGPSPRGPPPPGPPPVRGPHRPPPPPPPTMRPRGPPPGMSSNRHPPPSFSSPPRAPAPGFLNHVRTPPGPPPITDSPKVEATIEKSKVVYSSAPVLNKDKNKRKEEKASNEIAKKQKFDETVLAPVETLVKEKPKETSVESTENLFDEESIAAEMAELVRKEKKNNKKKFIRSAAGTTWEDTTLADWNPDDFRIFCGDLGNEVTDDMLARTFQSYSSFQKAKVVRDKRSQKTRGYGFVSFKDPNDFVRAMREMNGKYVGNRPIKLRKSCWKDRQIDIVKRKEKEKKRLGLK